MAEIDFAALAGGGAGNAAKILETGTYTFVCTKAVAAKTSGGDKDCIKCTFVVEGGPRNGAPAWNQFTLSPDSEQSMTIFFRQMAAFGLGLDFFKTLPKGAAGVSKLAEALVQRRVKAKVEHEAYNGEPRVRLSGFAAAGTAVPGGPVAGVVPLAGTITIRMPTAGMPEIQQPQPQPAAQPAPVQPAAAQPQPAQPLYDESAGAGEEDPY